MDRPEDRTAAPESKRIRMARHFRTWLLTILLLVVVHFATEQLFTSENLRRADDYFRKQVNDAGAFHVSGLFFKHLLTFYSPPAPAPAIDSRPKRIDVPLLEAAFRSWIRTVKQILHEGPVTMITGFVALIVGFVVMLHPRVNNSFNPYLPLLLGPVVGSILVYLLLGTMELAGWLLGAGGKTIAYFVTPGPLLKECWAIVFEERQHHFVEGLIERLTKKV